MPNWCSTSLAFYPKRDCPAAIDQLHDFYQKLSTRTETTWDLGLTVFGVPEADLNEMNLRTTIEECYLDQDDIGEYIRVNAEDAWSPVTDLYDYLLRTKYTLLTYCLAAEEPGCSLYINTDRSKNHRFFEDEYLIDFYPPEGSPLESESGCYYCSCAKEVVGYISDLFHRQFKSLKDIYRFIDSGYAEGLWIHEFEKTR